MQLTLVRHAYLRSATLGHLHAGDFTCATLEEPWTPDVDGPGGQRREFGAYEACVPDGIYSLVPHTGTLFQNVWCLVNTELGVYRWPQDLPEGQKWGRATILIHSGNRLSETVGCVLIGLSHIGSDSVFASRAALDKLRAVIGTKTSHQLEIRPTAGTKES